MNPHFNQVHSFFVLLCTGKSSDHIHQHYQSSFSDVIFNEFKMLNQNSIVEFDFELMLICCILTSVIKQ